MTRASRSSSRAASPASISNTTSSRRQSRIIVQDMPERRLPSRGSVGQRKTSIFSKSSQNASVEDFSLRRRSTTLNSITGTSKVADIKCWDGNKRTTSSWDCLRRDPELWFPSGDCLIHFYERGQSRRGASLRVLLADIEASNCRPLLEKACAFPVPDSPTSSASSSSDDGGFFSNPSSNGKHELYIPAPAHLSREEALQYHLTTRNFFAWMFEKSLVGHRLGDALISLQERMNEFRPDPEENQDDLLAYIDVLGYTDFRSCPDHALAVLQFAEQFEYRELWTDAFVHCAGMNDILVTSSEFMSISRTTKALITRAHLEMDVRLDRAGKALGNFLEDDLANGSLDLSSEAQRHLERFRSCLHSFYVQKEGYWPPTNPNRKSSALPKSILRSMYFDFRSLYEYLVDHEFTSEMAEAYPTAGGSYGLQTILTFDKRNRYSPLPNPLPRIPVAAYSPMQGKSKPLSKIFGNKQAKMDNQMASLCALTMAANCEDVKVMESSLVREYFRFEREWTLREEEKISSPDARKVRWFLVYTILQTIISVTRAPQEVRDTEGVEYPLCCQTAGTPPWTLNKPTSSLVTPVEKPVELPTPTSQIHPVYRNTGNEIPSPLIPGRATNTLAQSTPNLSRAGRTAPPIAPLTVRHPQPRKPFCEILINGYGNGTDIHKGTIPIPDPPFLCDDGEMSEDNSPLDPQTPSSGTSGSTAPSSHWSAREGGEYNHENGPDSPSIYDEGNHDAMLGEETGYGLGLAGANGVVSNEWKRLGMSLVRGLELERERVRTGAMEEAGRWGTASVESWAPRRVNPEVEQYVGTFY